MCSPLTLRVMSTATSVTEQCDRPLRLHFCDASWTEACLASKVIFKSYPKMSEACLVSKVMWNLFVTGRWPVLSTCKYTVYLPDGSLHGDSLPKEACLWRMTRFWVPDTFVFIARLGLAFRGASRFLQTNNNSNAEACVNKSDRIHAPHCVAQFLAESQTERMNSTAMCVSFESFRRIHAPQCAARAVLSNGRQIEASKFGQNLTQCAVFLNTLNGLHAPHAAAMRRTLRRNVLFKV